MLLVIRLVFWLLPSISVCTRRESFWHADNSTFIIKKILDRLIRKLFASCCMRNFMAMDFYFCNLIGVHPIKALVQHESDLIEREKTRPNWRLIVRYQSRILMSIVSFLWYHRTSSRNGFPELENNLYQAPQLSLLLLKGIILARTEEQL